MFLHRHCLPGGITPIFPPRCFLVNCYVLMGTITIYFVHQDCRLRAGEVAHGKARLPEGCLELLLPWHRKHQALATLTSR